MVGSVPLAEDQEWFGGCWCWDWDWDFQFCHATPSTLGSWLAYMHLPDLTMALVSHRWNATYSCVIFKQQLAEWFTSMKTNHHLWYAALHACNVSSICCSLLQGCIDTCTTFHLLPQVDADPWEAFWAGIQSKELLLLLLLLPAHMLVVGASH